MKTNKDFILREIADEAVIVPTGEASKRINGMITLSETGVFIWKQYDRCQSLQEIVEKILEEYDLTEREAQLDVFEFTVKLVSLGMVEDVPEIKNPE